MMRQPEVYGSRQSQIRNLNYQWWRAAFTYNLSRWTWFFARFVIMLLMASAVAVVTNIFFGSLGVSAEIRLTIIAVTILPNMFMCWSWAKVIQRRVLDSKRVASFIKIRSPDRLLKEAILAMNTLLSELEDLLPSELRGLTWTIDPVNPYECRAAARFTNQDGSKRVVPIACMTSEDQLPIWSTTRAFMPPSQDLRHFVPTTLVEAVRENLSASTGVGF